MTPPSIDLAIDLETVSNIIRQVARDHVLPAFQNLDKESIYEKRPGEVVTDADIAAEAALSQQLQTYKSESSVLGEESVEDNHGLMDLCNSNGAVWIVDPIDGTQNFSNGSKHFAMMVVFREHNQSCAAWLYDPVNDLMYTAEEGRGAWLNNNPIRQNQRGDTISELHGSVGNHLRNTHQKLADKQTADLPTIQKRLRCCGQEYMALARGDIQFLQYGVHLKPWDHAPGVLLAREIGFHVAYLEDEAPYDPADHDANGYLMIAPDRKSWLGLRETLWDI